jgi:hypothetical protein
MRISIRHLTMLCSLLLTLGGFSSYAAAQVQFSDDFESYNLYVGPTGNEGDIGGGWTAFANVFGDYPGCSQYWYGYGTFPAPNKDSGFSNITTGSTGQALNVFSDYEQADHGKSACVETSVFQERDLSAADAGSYTFMFDVDITAPLGVGVNTYGFIKLLDPNNGYSLDLFETVSTVTAGSKSITVALDATADGKILQWGFTTTASNYAASARIYDNVSFASAQPVTPRDPDAIPIPYWALLLMAGLLAYLGATKLRARKEN